MTIIGTYYVLKAKISIETDPALAGALAINVPFRITNESVLPIYDLEYYCGVVWIKGSKGQTMSDFRVASDKRIPVLEAGESASIGALSRILGFESQDTVVTEGDIQFVATYSPKLFYWRRLQTKRRFEARVDDEGKTRWYHKSLSE